MSWAAPAVAHGRSNPWRTGSVDDTLATMQPGTIPPTLDPASRDSSGRPSTPEQVATAPYFQRVDELVQRVERRLDRALVLERITTARTADGRRLWKLVLRDPESRYFVVKQPVAGDDPFADEVVEQLVNAAARDFDRGRSQAR